MKTDTIANCKLRAVVLVQFAFCILHFTFCNSFAFAAPAALGTVIPAGPGRVVPAGPGKTVMAGPGKIVPAGPGKVVTAGPGKVVAAGPGKGHWRTFRKESGLVNNILDRFLQDREGYLWIGTNGGVSRYDGQGFVNFTTQDGLADNIVVAICQDREGHLWFGTYGGASRYDPSAGSGQAWKTFTTKDGLAGNNIQSIIQDREGHLWFGARDGGISRYDGKTFSTGSGQAFTNFTQKDGLASDRVWSAFQDQEGFLWFGTDGGGVSRYDGKAFKTFTTQDGVAGNSVYMIFQDREGFLWFATLGGGASRYDGRKFITFSTKDGLVDNAVQSVIQDREGVLWFGTSGSGVSRYDPSTGSGQVPSATLRSSPSARIRGSGFTLLTTKDGLGGNMVERIFQDREGYLWFATDGGASRYDPRTFITFTTEDGLASNSNVQSIFQDREGVLWFGTYGGGVSRYDRAGRGRLNDSQDRSPPPSPGGPSGRGTFTTFTAQDGLAHNWIGTITQDRKGNLWFSAGFGGGVSGVSRYDGKTFTTFTTKDGLKHDYVESILEDREGNLWFGTWGGGVSRYDGKTFTTFTTQDGLAHNWIGAITQDREGNLWFGSGGIGSGGGGVSRYDGKTFTTFTAQDGLIDNTVQSIFQDREGHLWFGTLSGGVSRYDGKTFANFTVQDGLPDNQVNSIAQDQEGVLYFGTSNGVSRYDGQVFQTIMEQDGLAGNSIWPILQDREGTIWVGTSSGVTRFRLPSPTPPTVTVEDVVADQRYTNVPDVAIPSTVKLTTFEFRAGMNFKTRPEAMVYRYRLKGYDKDWKNTHAQRVEYQDLPRGTYTFEVLAVDRDLTYSKTPATVTLRVRLPYERIGWLSALSVALTLVAWQSIRVVRRDRKLREVNTALSSANKNLFNVNLELQDKSEAMEEVNAHLARINRQQDATNLELQQKTEALDMSNRELQQKTEALEVAKDAAEGANRAKSLFLANMSHEIRTPMNAILGYAQILQRKPTLAQDDRKAVETIRRSGDHLLTLINDVLDISRIEAGRLELHPSDFDLQSLLQGIDVMFRLRCEQKRLTWKVERPKADRIPIHADEAKLMQVLVNLLGNAVKFTDEGGVTLRVTASPEAMGGTGRRPVRPGEPPGPPESVSEQLYLFEVEDTGPGISPEAQKAIFEPFHQEEAGVKKGGTGLGLAISQKVLELMGGQLDLESTPGQGSRFFFTVPLPPAAREMIAASSEQWTRVQRLKQGHHVKALLADDILENRDVLSTMLTDIGVEVALVENGKEAVEQALKETYDIALLDIRMPVMGGLEAARLIRQEKGQDAPRLVAISASALDHERRQYLEEGFDGFIPKPFRAEQVYACLSDLLHVEYEYAEPAAPVEASALDLKGIALSGDLLRRLREAAELSSVTDLEEALGEVEGLGLQEGRLAAHLRALSQDFKMEEILRQ